MMYCDLKRISENIKKLRYKKGWKFSYVSKRTEIEEKRLRKIENGQVTPNHFELYRLARVFEVSIDDIVYRDLK